MHCTSNLSKSLKFVSIPCKKLYFSKTNNRIFHIIFRRTKHILLHKSNKYKNVHIWTNKKKRKYGKNFIVFPFIKGFFLHYKKGFTAAQKKRFSFSSKILKKGLKKIFFCYIHRFFYIMIRINIDYYILLYLYRLNFRSFLLSSFSVSFSTVCDSNHIKKKIFCLLVQAAIDKLIFSQN